MIFGLRHIMIMMSGSPLHEGLPLPFSLEQMNGSFIMILICFLLLASIYKGDFGVFKNNLSLLLSFRRSEYSKYEVTASTLWHSFYLVLQFAILASISIYSIFFEYEEYMPDHHPLRTMTVFLLCISLFILLKFVLYNIIGYIYDCRKDMEQFRYRFVVTIEALGLLYFIPTLLLLYANNLHAEITIFMLVLFIIAQLILFYRIIVYFVREKLNFLFLIVYLCTVEIIPYIFLTVALIFLYKTDELTVLW